MPLKGKKILITCGPTWVAIDGMRVISNQSTGEMGHLLTEALIHSKSKVTLLQGPVTHPLSGRLKPYALRKFSFFDELNTLLKEELKRPYDCIIHAAAVSDFKPHKTFSGKISSRRAINLKMVPTPKLIDTIKKRNPNAFLVGFKLESFLDDRSAVNETKKLFTQAKCDLVVANFLTAGKYEALLLSANRTLLGKAKSKNDLVRMLVSTLNSAL